MTDDERTPLILGYYRTPLILLTQLAFIAAIALISAYVILPSVEPVRQGYFCDDPSLKYKFHPNTVDISAVHLTGYFLILLTIFFVECQPLRSFGATKASQNDPSSLNERLTSGAYAFFASQLGLATNFLLYQLVKYSCGRLRPHFFEVCRPNVACEAGTYVDAYECTGQDAKLVRDVHLSFYSGHAATAFYYATFLTIYTQMRLRRRLLHCLPFLFVANTLLYAAASFVALSRIADNKHHNADVAFGSLVGTIVGFSVVVFYLREILQRIRLKPYIAPESVISLERRRFPTLNSANDHTA